MATAILTSMFPRFYTVLDVRASEALGQRDLSSPRYFLAYLTACRRMAAEFGVTLRDFDRANWQWSKVQSESRAVQCKDICDVPVGRPHLPDSSGPDSGGCGLIQMVDQSKSAPIVLVGRR